MISFKQLLLEGENFKIGRHLYSKQEIRKAISKWDSIPEGEKHRVANVILQAAEEFGYIVRHKEILEYADKESDKKVTSRAGKTTMTLGDIRRMTADYTDEYEFQVIGREQVVDVISNKVVGKYNQNKETMIYKRGSSLEKWLKNNSFIR